MAKADFGVFIGRFQPLHIGHEHVIRQALDQVEKAAAASTVEPAHTARNAEKR